MGMWEVETCRFCLKNRGGRKENNSFQKWKEEKKWRFLGHRCSGSLCYLIGSFFFKLSGETAQLIKPLLHKPEALSSQPLHPGGIQRSEVYGTRIGRDIRGRWGSCLNIGLWVPHVYVQACTRVHAYLLTWPHTPPTHIKSSDFLLHTVIIAESGKWVFQAKD